jgi:hypothetical protein
MTEHSLLIRDEQPLALSFVDHYQAGESGTHCFGWVTLHLLVLYCTGSNPRSFTAQLINL